MLPLFGILFKGMWRVMHRAGYFAHHRHYVEWMDETEGGVHTAAPPVDSFLQALDYSKSEIVFPGPYTDGLERAIKRHEGYWLPRMFELPENGSAVDLGCGFGRSIEWLQGRYSRVFGVDLSRRLLERAEKRFADSPNVRFLLGDGLTLPSEIPDDSIDLIYSFTVFQHIPRSFVRSYLAEFKKRSGRVARSSSTCCRGFMRPGDWARLSPSGVSATIRPRFASWWGGPDFASRKKSPGGWPKDLAIGSGFI